MDDQRRGRRFNPIGPIRMGHQSAMDYPVKGRLQPMFFAQAADRTVQPFHFQATAGVEVFIQRTTPSIGYDVPQKCTCFLYIPFAEFDPLGLGNGDGLPQGLADQLPAGRIFTDPAHGQTGQGAHSRYRRQTEKLAP